MSADEPLIRPYTMADFDNLLSLEQATFPHPQSASQLQSLLKSPSMSWVVLKNHHLVGFAIVRAVLDEAELLDIAVDEAWQGQGIADALLDTCLHELQQQGVTSLYLEVRASNDRAINFYRRHRFEEQGRRKNYYHAGDQPREDAVLMVRPIG